MKAFAPIAALALTACAATTPPLLTGTPSAALGQTAQVGSMQVTPIAIVEDSRCPINARCIWAGRLTVRVRVSYSGGREELVGPITLGEPMNIGREQLALESASPDKIAGQPHRPSDYRFTFAVTSAR